MLQEGKSYKSVLDLSMDAHLSLKKYCEELAQAVAGKLNHEELVHWEKQMRTTLILHQGGSLFGQENKGMTQKELENLADDLQTFTKKLIGKYYYPGLECVETKVEEYTQILIQGIFYGQNKA